MSVRKCVLTAFVLFLKFKAAKKQQEDDEVYPEKSCFMNEKKSLQKNRVQHLYQ